ncbi:positive regulation of renal water transport [Homalodisca vitripennis]|nr:positive regulation of renal water transport [Homalodisca vitripennis]
MNFRLQGTESPAELAAAVVEKRLDELWEKDELSRVRASGEAFSELQEERPSFRPTYKHEFGKTQYSNSRRPAWTDRVLFKANKDAYQNVTLDVAQTSYQSIESYVVSDHKPVFAEFNIKVFSHHSDREVTFQPIDTWYLDEENTAVCHLPSDVTPSIWDWVGVYQDNLLNLHDYISYIYLPHVRDDKSSNAGNNVTLRFPATAVRAPGLYRLLYFTRGASSLLGISAPFSAVHRTGDAPIATRLNLQCTTVFIIRATLCGRRLMEISSVLQSNIRLNDFPTRLSQDNRIKQRQVWLLLGWVTAERSCPCKQPACPVIGGGSEVTFKPFVARWAGGLHPSPHPSMPANKLPLMLSLSTRRTPLNTSDSLSLSSACYLSSLPATAKCIRKSQSACTSNQSWIFSEICNAYGSHSYV